MKGKKGNRAVRDGKVDPARRRRRTRKQTAVAAAEERAQRAQVRAAEFAAGRKSAEMPGFMVVDPQYAGAAAIWRYHEPLLKERNFWGPEFIAPFTGFCIYYDEFLAADREVKIKGWGVEGKSTSGGDRFWKNPAVDVRDHAFSRVMELSQRYAFTPLDLYKLERESAAAASTRSGGGRHAPDVPANKLPLDQSGVEQDNAAGPGGMTQFDSEPPAGLPN